MSETVRMDAIKNWIPIINTARQLKNMQNGYDVQSQWRSINILESSYILYRLLYLQTLLFQDEREI